MDTTNWKLEEGPAAGLALKYGVSLRGFYREVQFKLLIKAIAILISPVKRSLASETRRARHFLSLKSSLNRIASANSFMDFRLCRLSRCNVR